MKRIVSIVLACALLVCALVSCGGAKGDEYKLTLVVDHSVSGAKVADTLCAVITDAEGKIVAVRFDAVEVEYKLTEGALVVPTEIISKVEKGAGYPMTGGTWAEQTKAYEDYIIGKTLAEVADVDNSLVTGCTMPNSPNTFKALIAKAVDATNTVTFTSETVPTLGASFSTTATGAYTEDENKAEVNSYAGAVAVAGGKIVAAAIDTAVTENGTFSINDEDALVLTAAEYKGTKFEQGAGYPMTGGTWAEQTAAFCTQVVGLNATTLADLEPVSDAMAAAGCTMPNSPNTFKPLLIKALGVAR